VSHAPSVASSTAAMLANPDVQLAQDANKKKIACKRLFQDLD
jgi:hypothetical protein